MRNRLLAVICILSLSLALVACGNKEEHHDASVPSTETETSVVENEAATEEETASQESTELVKDEEESETTSTSEEPQPEIVASGVLAEGKIEWKIVETTLYVSGTGAIPDFPNDPAQVEKFPSEFSPDVLMAWQSYNNLVEKIVIEEGITRIGDNNFAYFSSAKEIVIPDSVKEIGKFACRETGITSLDLKQVTSLDRGAFMQVQYITEVIIPATIKEIPNSCFCCCFALEKIVIENGVEKIEENAFLITEVFDLEGVRTGGSHGFEIHIPESVTMIEEGSIYASGYEDSSVRVCGKAGSYVEKWVKEINTYTGVSFVVE